MQRESEFDDSQIGAEVTAGSRHLLDQELPDLPGENDHLIGRQRLEIGRG